MKKNIPLCIIAAAAIAASALPCVAQQSHKGEKSVGIKGGYVTRNTSAMAGIFFHYRFSNHFTLSPNIDYVFRNNGSDAFLFNIDTHYPIALGTSRVEFYPIAGLNYSSWGIPGSDNPNEDDVSTRRNQFGLNAGIGFNYQATPTLKLFIQGKYTAVSKYSTGIFSAGIAYTF